MDDETSPQMMASYTEIVDADADADAVGVGVGGASRPVSLCRRPLDESGRVVYDFVADDLEYKIKISSPVSKTFVDRRKQIDATVLNDLESEAKKIAHSVDGLIENLAGVLHSISSITADNVEVYKDAVTKTCDSIDSNIKCMYTILAKGEEVFKAMGPVQSYAARITEIRRLLNLFENNI